MPRCWFYIVDNRALFKLFYMHSHPHKGPVIIYVEVFTGQGIPNLQPHRTPTTLCVPEPVFHDVARHTFKLPQGFPVQKHLLAAFTGSWVAAPSIPGSGGVPFELWRRYYYPNIRDQMVAKASLPLAKLCAMVTMQKQGEANIQTFSLPLNVLAGDEMDGMRQDRMQDTGLLDVTVKYRQVKTVQPTAGHAAQKEHDQNHVCLSLEVFQACGLQAAALLHAKSNPSLSYPAEVGVNAYIVIQFPLGKKHKHVTRTVARTFSPEFSYNADILLPVVIPSIASGIKRNLSLAEQLEESEMVYEVWHQMSRGVSGDQVIRSGTEVKSGRKNDVLLGVGRVPLIKLLAHKTGVKGWFPIYLPSESDIGDPIHNDDVDKIVGGLELGISFSEAEDRDHVIHLSRGVGWSPPPGIDCDEDWLDREDLSKNKHWEFCLKINKAWIPSSELHSINVSGKKLEKSVRTYARYKLYNKAPICSRALSVKDSGDGKLICELKHSKDVVLQASPSLTWHMKEECLEIQLWLSNMRHSGEKNSRKRDRLLGSAFVDVSSLLLSQQRKHRQISGLYPVFRSGASNLCGACIHVQASLHMSSEDTSDQELEFEQHLSSDESVDGGSPIEGHVADSSSMISSQDHTPSVKPSTQHETNRQVPVTGADDDTFIAHVIIEQALHLPTVPGDNDARLLPNVYVSYQTVASQPVACTPVVMSSCCPTWEYQKLERISNSSVKSQDLVFKVWHTSKACEEKGVDTKRPESVGGTVDSSSSEDRIIGFVPFDLSPLLAGMRQLIGWYNVTDFSGDCQGQIKLGVSPVNPVSPPQCLHVSRTAHIQPPNQDADFNTHFLISHGTDGSDHRFQIEGQLPSQLKDHHEKHLTGFRPHSNGDIREIEVPPVCSTSLLFSQLRHNMKELDALQESLNVKLRSSSRKSDDGHVQGYSSVRIPPHSPFPGIDTTKGTLLRTLEAVRVDSMECKSPRTDFEESARRHEVMPVNGGETSMISNERIKLSSLISPLEMEHAGDFVDHKHAAERTIDAMLDKGAEAVSSNGIFPFDEGKEENVLHDPVEDSFFSVEKQKSLAEDRWPSVDSELSVSDISGDLSASGYVQDNTKSARFADLKDSWLSSEEEDDTNMSQSKKPGLSTAPSAVNVDSLNNATDKNFHCHEIDHHTSEHDNDSAGDEDNGEKDCYLVPSQVDGDHSSEDSIVDDAAFTTGATVFGSVSDTLTPEGDHENEPNLCSSYDTLHSSELSKQASQFSFPTSYQDTSTATLPNFFMPSEQLEESMRALRLGSSNNTGSSNSKLLARSSSQQTKGNFIEKFAKSKQVYNARKDERPPISNSEVDRIAKIFSFNSETVSQTK